MRNSLITRISKAITRIKENKIFNFTTLPLYHYVVMLVIFTTLSLYHCTTASAEWSATVPNPVLEYHYTYDSNGNITDIYNAVAVSTSTFAYDEVDRLTQAIGPYGTKTYSYNAVGDPTDITIPVTDPNENGNITSYNNKTIAYNYENKPTKITDSNTNLITEFAYDYSGQRIKKVVYNSTTPTDTQTTFYVGNIYEESYVVNVSSPVLASTTTVNYVYAGSIRVAGLISQTTVTGTEENTYYYHGDHLGSSSLITDDNGTVIRNISYQPWGNVDNNTQAPGAPTDYDPSHKFTGQILDDSTELYYYGARYYDPTLRRFITPDTIVQSPYDPQSLNRYAYCRNNPIIYTDPSGHFVLELIGIAILANVGYHATQGDIHNWNDAWRYTYQGAAWGAAIAGAMYGISYLNPQYELSLYLEAGGNQATLASMTISDVGTTFSYLGYGGAGLTGAVQLAQLGISNLPTKDQYGKRQPGPTTAIYNPLSISDMGYSFTTGGRIGGDDPGADIGELRKRLHDPSTPQREKSRIKRRIGELSRRPSGRAHGADKKHKFAETNINHNSNTSLSPLSPDTAKYIGVGMVATGAAIITFDILTFPTGEGALGIPLINAGKTLLGY